MFKAIDCRNNKIGVLDTADETIEWYTPSQLRVILEQYRIIIQGVSMVGDSAFSVEGLSFNFNYLCKTKIGRWWVVVLNRGSQTGATLSNIIQKPTVLFYDSSVDWDKLVCPLGQFVASYYCDTILTHRDDLILDASIPEWRVTREEMTLVKDFIRRNMK